LRRVELDPLYERHGIIRRHADYVVVMEHVVFIVENTARARIGDVNQLEETLETIVGSEVLRGELLGNPTIRGRTFILLLHSPKVNSRVSLYLKSKADELSRRYKALGIKVVASTTPCSRELETLLRRQ
jgi:site-specific DNA-cytosine methylase